MLRICLSLAALCLSPCAQASWHYNPNAGFGLYQPEGWKAQDEGRATTLTGPEGHGPQAEIFLGSDWISRVDSLNALAAHIERTEGEAPKAVKVSGIDGFQIGNQKRGAIFLLRFKENVIVIRYDIKGPKDAQEEAATALSSVEVRTDGLEYP